MSDYLFRLAQQEDATAIVRFVNRHWGSRHPLVNLPDFFHYYYDDGEKGLRFALAERHGRIAALAGYLPASRMPQPDVWVSIWVADPTAKGSGLELMAALPALTGCRTLACNNIRPETRPFYEFLGYSTGRVGHFYRLADCKRYKLCQIRNKVILPVAASNLVLHDFPTAEALAASGFAPPRQHNPYKDLWYITRRYYAYPRQNYRVFGAYLKGQTTPKGLLATRTVAAEGAVALRIVDYIGPPKLLPGLGRPLQDLMEQSNAEYADFYCAGIAPGLLEEAGFVLRSEDDPNIIPNYLDPLLQENTEYYYFTSRPENFMLFKADGDQDRPNIPVPQNGEA